MAHAEIIAVDLQFCQAVQQDGVGRVSVQFAQHSIDQRLYVIQFTGPLFDHGLKALQKQCDRSQSSTIALLTLLALQMFKTAKRTHHMISLQEVVQNHLINAWGEAGFATWQIPSYGLQYTKNKILLTTTVVVEYATAEMPGWKAILDCMF